MTDIPFCSEYGTFVFKHFFAHVYDFREIETGQPDLFKHFFAHVYDFREIETGQPDLSFYVYVIGTYRRVYPRMLTK